VAPPSEHYCAEKPHYVSGRKEYLIFMSAESLIPQKQTLKFLCKLKHFPRRYKRKRVGVFSEHSVEQIGLREGRKVNEA